MENSQELEQNKVPAKIYLGQRQYQTSIQHKYFTVFSTSTVYLYLLNTLTATYLRYPDEHRPIKSEWNSSQ